MINKMENNNNKMENKMNEELTQEELKEMLHYDKDSGDFTWIISKNGVNLGDKAGLQHKEGHWYIDINKKQYTSQRLACLYINGELPFDAKHIDGDITNNSWNNLDEVPDVILSEYEDDPDIGNELEMLSPDSGVDGVYFDRCEGKWLVANNVLGMNIAKGHFICLTSAINNKGNSEHKVDNGLYSIIVMDVIAKRRGEVITTEENGKVETIELADNEVCHVTKSINALKYG